MNLSTSKRILTSLKPKQVLSIECLIDENFPTTAAIMEMALLVSTVIAATQKSRVTTRLDSKLLRGFIVGGVLPLARTLYWLNCFIILFCRINIFI